MISCATDYKRGPSGGPDDKTPPEVFNSSIADNSLNIENDPEIEIVFSEYINRNSTRNAINISPRSVMKKSSLEWYDKSVKINFDGLPEDQTVVININSELKDTQGNSLLRPYSISFSTGGNIDKRSVKGRIAGGFKGREIIDLVHSKIKVALYKYDPDTININNSDPEYLTGVTEDMELSMDNIYSGKFVLTAFIDENRDSKLQYETEALGFYNGAADLINNEALEAELVIGYFDREPPFIKETRTVGPGIIKIVFSEELKDMKNVVDSIYIDKVAYDFKEFPSYEKDNTVFIATSKLFTGNTVKILLNDIADIYGNAIRGEYKTKNHTVTDTVPEQNYRILNRIRGDVFSDNKLVLKTNRFFNDSLKCKLINASDSTETGKNILKKDYPYNIVLDLSSENDLKGEYDINILKKDSVIYSSRINIIESEGYGSISGTITSDNHNFTLFCKNIKKDTEHYKVNNKKYKIELRPGKYLIALLDDNDQDGVMDMNIQQLSMEKGVFFKDTVNIRKNWETTGIDFIIN